MPLQEVERLRARVAELEARPPPAPPAPNINLPAITPNIIVNIPGMGTMMPNGMNGMSSMMPNGMTNGMPQQGSMGQPLQPEGSVGAMGLGTASRSLPLLESPQSAQQQQAMQDEERAFLQKQVMLLRTRVRGLHPHCLDCGRSPAASEGSLGRGTHSWLASAAAVACLPKYPEHGGPLPAPLVSSPAKCLAFSNSALHLTTPTTPTTPTYTHQVGELTGRNRELEEAVGRLAGQCDELRLQLEAAQVRCSSDRGASSVAVH